MFNPESFCAKTKLELLESLGRRALVLCPSERIEATLIYLKNHESFSLMTGLHFVEEENCVYYWLEKIDSGFCLGVKTVLDEKLPTISSIYPLGAKLEGEISSRSKVKFAKSLEVSLEDRGPLAPSYQSVDVSKFDETVLVAPKVNGIFAPLGEKFLEVKSLDMEVVDCRFRVQRRSSFTEEMEGMRPWRAGNSFLKLGGFDGFLWSSLFFRALEAGNGIMAPDKALAVRMIFTEFGRILSHTEYCANVAFQIEAQELYFKCLRWCQLCSDLMASYSGNDFSIGILAYGGIHREPPSNWFAHCMKQLNRVQLEIEREISNISKNRFWKKTETLAVLSKENLLKWSIAGAALRASGVNYDMRKVHSYDLYGEVDFDVPIGVNGALYDRTLVRLSEAVESIKIIDQLLDNLPTGDLVSRDVNHFSHFDRPNEKRQAYIEAASYQWNVEDRLYHSSLESVNGVCLLSFKLENGLVKNARVSMPDINTLACVEELMLGQNLENLNLIISSLPFNLRSIESY